MKLQKEREEKMADLAIELVFAKILMAEGKETEKRVEVE